MFCFFYICCAVFIVNHKKQLRMKKILMFAFLALVAMMTSCEKGDSVPESKENVVLTNKELSESRSVIRQEITKELTPMFLMLYQDYTTKGYFDNDFFELNAKKTGYISDFEIDNIYSQLRSGNMGESNMSLDLVLENARKYLNDNQVDILNEFITAITQDARSVEDVYNKAERSLSVSEYNQVFTIMVSTEGLLDSFYKFIELESSGELRAGSWKGWSKELAAFACNAAASGIGGVWSTMAGGVAVAVGAGALAATGVGAVVGFLGTYVISRVACP